MLTKKTSWASSKCRIHLQLTSSVQLVCRTRATLMTLCQKWSWVLVLLILLTSTQLTFTCLNSTIETLEQGVKYVNNESTRMTSKTLFWCIYCQLWTYFTPFSCFSIVNLEQVNVSREWIFGGDLFGKISVNINLFKALYLCPSCRNKAIDLHC